jgi:ElaB/YqjD/DUF883 family membrane-anchored ribosome-binding protein
MDNGGIWPGDESYFQNIRETALQDTIEQLTKELGEARAEIERLREYTTCTLESTDAEMDDKDIQIIKKDKLIEQMREALIVADSLVTSLIDTHVDRCASIYDFDRDIIKAALAAERGE